MQKNSNGREDRFVLVGIACYFAVLVLVALNTNGTCDSGDSLFHFLFSKYAFQHPGNFLDHWAKPLFVLLSAPFAQFGFIGIKVFNCCVAAITAWFCYRTAKSLKYKNAWLAAAFLCFTPGYFIHIFSGLTEPLFGLMLILGVYLFFNQKVIAAVCIVSFLPFVRSEGLIIIGVFGAYLLVSGQYKYILWLLLGHLVYSIAGSFYHHDLLWVFTKIPYSESSGKYGSGNFSHFIIQLNYIIGIPLYVLLAMGLVKKCMDLFGSKNVRSFFDNPEIFLVYGLFIAFILAHSLFWYFGVFESMGLKRVLIAIVPVAIIIALDGYNFIASLFKRKEVSYYIIAAVFAGFVFVFPFVPNPASVNWERDLALSPDQVLVEEATGYVKENFPENIPLFYAHPYLHITLNRDPFNESYIELKDIFSVPRPAHYVVIWDSSFSKLENGVSLEQLQADTRLKLLKKLESTDRGRTIQLVIFKNAR